MEVVMVVVVVMVVAMVMAMVIPVMAMAMAAILAMAVTLAPMGLRMVMPPRLPLLRNQLRRVPASKSLAFQTSPHRDVLALFLFNGFLDFDY